MGFGRLISANGHVPVGMFFLPPHVWPQEGEYTSLSDHLPNMIPMLYFCQRCVPLSDTGCVYRPVMQLVQCFICRR